MKRYDIKNTAIPKRIIRHVCSKLFMPIVFGEKILTEGDSDNFIRPEGIEGYLACCLASTTFLPKILRSDGHKRRIIFLDVKQ